MNRRIKKMAGNLIYPPTKILINDLNPANIDKYFQVITDATSGKLTLLMPQNGISIDTDENFIVDMICGTNGTPKVEIVEILSANACTECRFEYGFGVRHRYYGRQEHIDPFKQVTNNYYDIMSNPSAIDPLTGLFSDAVLEIIHDNIIDQINSHVGVHPEAGPVVRALSVYDVERDADTDDFDVDITGTAAATVTGADAVLFTTAMNANIDVLFAVAVDDLTVRVVMKSGATIAGGAVDNSVTVTEDNSRIALEGLFANPYFEVVEPRGFRINKTTIIQNTKDSLTGQEVFDLFFNQKHQGSISQWADLNQPIDTLYCKLIIRTATDTHAIHGASHMDGYVNEYQIYFPSAFAVAVLDVGSVRDPLPVFGTVSSVGGDGRFPVDSTAYLT